MISSLHLATTLLYNVPWLWSQYLNRYLEASASEVVEVLGGIVPFSLESIPVDLEEGRYIIPIIKISLTDLVSGRRSAGSGAPRSGGGVSDGDSGGNKKPMPKVDATGGTCKSAGAL